MRHWRARTGRGDGPCASMTVRICPLRQFATRDVESVPVVLRRHGTCSFSHWRFGGMTSRFTLCAGWDDQRKLSVAEKKIFDNGNTLLSN